MVRTRHFQYCRLGFDPDWGTCSLRSMAKNQKQTKKSHWRFSFMSLHIPHFVCALAFCPLTTTLSHVHVCFLSWICSSLHFLPTGSCSQPLRSSSDVIYFIKHLSVGDVSLALTLKSSVASLDRKILEGRTQEFYVGISFLLLWGQSLDPSSCLIKSTEWLKTYTSNIKLIHDVKF